MDGIPLGPTKGTVAVAADNMRVFPRASLRSSCRKARKFAVSFELIVLHPIPWLAGYSQLAMSESTRKERK